MNELDQLVSDLVAINSINPDLVPGAPGETEIANLIVRWLIQAGLEVQLVESASGRPCVVGIARGTGGGKTLMLNGHMDTVGVAGMANPHQPSIRGDRLYGRGAYDMKGGLAACMSAAAAVRQHRLRGDVILTAVADEEYTGFGTKAITERYHADGAIIAEFTELQLILAHKGFVWLEIETTGRAAHGSRPDLGVDAITRMGRILVELENLEKELESHPRHKLLGSGSLHASLIKGGQELSSYPENCIVSVERRTLPNETPETIEAEIQEIIQRIQRADPSFKAIIRRGIDRPPMETPEDALITKTIKTASKDVLKHSPAISGVPYWTDAATLWAAGIPTVLFGPAGGGAHAVEEWVELKSVKTCAEIFLATAIEFCQ